MKLLLKIVAPLLIAVILLGVGGHYLAAGLVKTKIAELTQEATGTSVTIGGLDLNAFRGYIQIQDIRIGNPPGYKSETAFEIKTLTVRVQPKSLLTDTILVRSVNIEQPFVSYEMKSARTSNIREIQENIERYAAAQESDAPGEKKTVKIDALHIRRGKVRVGATLLGGRGVTVSMPETTITDIDTAKDEEQAASLPVVLARILRTVLGTAGHVVSEVSQEAGGAGSAASDAAKGLLEGLKNLAP